jgi:hypothetical protein
MDDVDQEDDHKGFPPRRQPSASGPWCWQQKKSLNLIMKRFSENGTACIGRSVYLALTELASDAHSASFIRSVAEIAHRACVSVRATGIALKQLEQIGLIQIDRRRAPEGFLKLPSRYTLTAIGTQCSSMRTRCASIRNDQQQISDADKKKESLRKKDKEVETVEKIAATTTDADELCQQLEPYFPEFDVRKELKNCNRWRAEKGLSPTTAKALLSWLRKAEPKIRRLRRKSLGITPAKLEKDETADPSFLREFAEHKQRTAGGY